MNPILSVIVPCRNQANHIRSVLESYLQALNASAIPFELVAVPNASSDNTETEVRRAADSDPRIQVIANAEGGWGRSVLVGLAKSSGRHLCYTNSARTDPHVLRDLVQIYLSASSDGELIAKVRRIQRNAPLRTLGSMLYNAEGRILFGVRSSDVNGTPKIFSRHFYETSCLASVDDLLDLELLAKAKRFGVRVVEMDVAGFQRHGGKSSTGFASAWRMYAGAIRLCRRLYRERNAEVA